MNLDVCHDPVRNEVLHFLDGRLVSRMPVVVPILEDDRCGVDCTYCGEMHWHGPYEGSAVAHCHGGEYYLRPPGSVGPFLWRGKSRPVSVAAIAGIDGAEGEDEDDGFGEPALPIDRWRG